MLCMMHKRCSEPPTVRKIINQRWYDAMHAAQKVLQCVVTSVVSGATHCVEIFFFFFFFFFE